MRRTVLALGILASLLLAGPAGAQSPASVTGTVADTSGAVVVGATVEAVVVDRPVARGTTGSDGKYRLQVPAGARFQLRARSEGFADFVANMGAARETVTRDITLQVGGFSDTLVVTASRGPEARVNVTSAVSVMTSQDIDALGSNSLAEVVRFVPGLAVEGTGREGAQTSLFARGGESDYNLVLIDGVRANLDGGAFDFSRLAGAEIERVEVVRGAQSSLWGSDAMGAVVQVFTRRSGANSAPRVSGSVEGGTFGTVRSDARLTGGALRKVDYQVGVTYRKSDGAFGDILTESDRFEQTAFDGGIGAALGKSASLRSNLRYSSGEGRNVGPITFGSRDTGGIYLTKDLSWTLTSNHVAGSRFTGTGTVNYYRYRNESNDRVGDPAYSTYTILEGTPNALYPNGVKLVRLIDVNEFNSLVAAGATPAPGQFLASRSTSDFPFTSARAVRRPAVRYQGDITWAGTQRFSAGYEWERERNPLVAVQDLNNNAFFVQQQFNAGDRWFATVGLRADAKDTFDTFVSPKLSAGGFLVPARDGGLSSVKVFGNIGKGIKSPSFGERYGGSFADPDPNLRVERAVSRDLGIETTFIDQRLRATVAYFSNDYKDQIAFRSGIAGDGIPEYINIDGSASDGWEVSGGLQRVAGLTLEASYSLVDTKVVTNVSTSQQFQPGQPLLRRPKHSGSFRAAYVVSRVTVDFNARFVGDRHDNSFLSLRTVPNAARPAAFTTDITVNPGYQVMGLGVSVKAHDALTVFLRVDNLADEKWDSALGYPGLPRAAVVGARFDIGAR